MQVAGINSGNTHGYPSPSCTPTMHLWHLVPVLYPVGYRAGAPPVRLLKPSRTVLTGVPTLSHNEPSFPRCVPASTVCLPLSFASLSQPSHPAALHACVCAHATCMRVSARARRACVCLCARDVHACVCARATCMCVPVHPSWVQVLVPVPCGPLRRRERAVIARQPVGQLGPCNDNTAQSTAIAFSSS